LQSSQNSAAVKTPLSLWYRATSTQLSSSAATLQNAPLNRWFHLHQERLDAQFKWLLMLHH
jgi:hypothetical protein